MFHPEDDGKTHINIYSKGKTDLGKFLTNFAHSPCITEDGPFNSLEGYWYWLSCKDDRLRTASGFKAKALGREVGAKDWLEGEDFKNKIRKAMIDKLEAFPKFKKQFITSTLPFVHYYVYGGKVVQVPQGDWIMEFWEFLRQEYKNA